MCRVSLLWHAVLPCSPQERRVSCVHSTRIAVGALHNLEQDRKMQTFYKSHQAGLGKWSHRCWRMPWGLDRSVYLEECSLEWELRLLVKSVLWSFNCEQMFAMGSCWCTQLPNGYSYNRMRAADVNRDRRVADAEGPQGNPSVSKPHSPADLWAAMRPWPSGATLHTDCHRFNQPENRQCQRAPVWSRGHTVPKGGGFTKSPRWLPFALHIGNQSPLLL